jgi:hypothetical protein
MRRWEWRIVTDFKQFFASIFYRGHPVVLIMTIILYIKQSEQPIPYVATHARSASCIHFWFDDMYQFLYSWKLNFYVSLSYVIQFWHAVIISFIVIVLNEKLIAWYDWMDLKETTQPRLRHRNSLFYCSHHLHYYFGQIKLYYLLNRSA